jgi:O-acetyl-ADP-ribose deacetylase (regulator of RNase III)
VARAGEATDDPRTIVLAPPEAGADPEAWLRRTIRRVLALADQRGAATLAVPALGAGLAGLPAQRGAELLIEETLGHLAGGSKLAEVRFVVSGEPALRLFESVHDAVRIAEQAKRWSS